MTFWKKHNYGDSKKPKISSLKRFLNLLNIYNIGQDTETHRERKRVRDREEQRTQKTNRPVSGIKKKINMDIMHS